MVEKICYIHYSNLNSVTGGSEESTKQIIDFLKEEGYKTTFISPFKLPESIQADKEITSIGLKVPKEIININTRPDILLINNPIPLSLSFVQSLPENLQEKTCVVWRTVAESLFPVKPNTLIAKFFTKERIKLQNKLGNLVKMNFVVSEAVKQSLLKSGVPKEKITNIGEQFNNKFDPSIRIESDPNIRSKYLDPDEFGILVVSRISPEKGMDWLVDLYQKLREERKNIELSNYHKIKINIVGPDNHYYAKFIKKQIKKISVITKSEFNADSVQIEFLGKKTADQLQEIYNIHDLFFMPSPAEGFGRVTAEALTTGLPVIGRSGCLATEEILNQSPYLIGTIVNNPNQAVKEIFNLINDSNTLNQLKINSYRWANNFYNSENSKIQLLQAINQI